MLVCDVIFCCLFLLNYAFIFPSPSECFLKEFIALFLHLIVVKTPQKNINIFLDHFEAIIIEKCAP